jgi:subtilisin
VSEHYIVLPATGVRGRVPVPQVDAYEIDTLDGRSSDATHRFTTVGDMRSGPIGPLRKVSQAARVIDELAGDGPKLVELSPASLAAARATVPDARIAPDNEYRPAVVSPTLVHAVPSDLGAPPLSVEVRCAVSDAPLAGAEVTALLDSERGVGASGVSDRAGKARLALGEAPARVEELRVKPPQTGAWGARAADVELDDGHVVQLRPIDLTFPEPDVLRHFYGADPRGDDGAAVRIGVIDTGIDGNHPDLTVHDGINAVHDEPDALHGDNGLGHGSHVAGIIAAHGSAPTGVRGLASAAQLVSLRVYPQGAQTATTYSIMKALLRAQDLECDLVNLSLEAPLSDEVLEDAIERSSPLTSTHIHV